MSSPETSAAPVCGNCRHWKRGKKDASNLGAPCPGECRYLVQGSAILTNQGLAHAAFYPNVHEKFEACSQFAPRLALLKE